MSSSEIALVSGKEYKVSHDGESWVTRVFLYKNAFGAFICQTHLGWSNGDLPTMCRAFAYIKEIPVKTPVLKPVKVVKKANEVMNQLLSEGYQPDENGYWSNGSDIAFSPAMWYYCGAVAPTGAWSWKDEWLKIIYVPEDEAI